MMSCTDELPVVVMTLSMIQVVWLMKIILRWAILDNASSFPWSQLSKSPTTRLPPRQSTTDSPFHVCAETEVASIVLLLLPFILLVLLLFPT
jgi:hypothetical protein